MCSLARLMTFFVSGVTICLIACVPDSDTHKPAQAKTASQSIGGAPNFSDLTPILQARCIRCHNSGTIDWNKEQNLVNAARSGELTRRVQGKLMPKPDSPEAQAITQDERDKILAWAASVTGGGSSTNAITSGPMVDQKIVVLTRCASCHGLNGKSISPEIPNLAGHSPTYIMTRLQGFLAPNQTGTMPETLQSIAKQFKLKYEVKGDSEISLSAEAADTFQSIADFFSNQKVQPSLDEFEQKQQALSADDKALFKQGQGIVKEQCVGCHLLPGLAPIDGAAMIFGQKETYLRSRLAQFKTGEGGTTMPGIVSGLSDGDIRALIVFLSNVHPAQVQSE